MQKIRPCLRWVGGKWRNIKQFVQFLPKDFDKHYYIEPFVGSAAMLIYKRPSRAYISDMNGDIYNIYKIIYFKPLELIKELEMHDKVDSEEHYYEVRNEFNRVNASFLQTYRVGSPDDDAIKQAGRFIYLNARCFNGLYRENANGEMNAPFAKDLKGMKKICNEKNIFALYGYLTKENVKIGWGDYETSLLHLKANSEIANSPVFFFLDPPYYPLTETASFTSYTSGPWADSDFIRLRIFVDEINRNGWKFLLCNHSVPFIKALFKDYYQVEHMVSRSVSRNAQDRKPVMEILVANYEIKQMRQTKVI